MYQPKTGSPCSCKRGVQRDNCQNCEGTGWVIDFKTIRELNKVTLEMVKGSCFGCRNCLWASCECSKGSKFVPKIVEMKGKEIPSCGGYAYYD